MNAKKNIAKSSQTTANSVSSRLYVCTTAAFIPSNWNTNSHMLTSMWPDASSCRIWYKTFRTSMNWHLNSLTRQCQLLNRSTLCLSHWPTSHFPLFFGYCWSRIFYRPAALPVIQTTVSNSFTRFHGLYPSPLPFAHTHIISIIPHYSVKCNSIPTQSLQKLTGAAYFSTINIYDYTILHYRKPLC